MPVLGAGGVLELRRELPPAVVIGPEAARLHVNGFDLSQQGFWTGDKVWVWGPKGLPFDLNGDGLPDIQGGFGMFFGSRLGLYGARSARLQSGASKWFGPENPFQASPGTEVINGLELYIFRDSLDRICFYNTLPEALDGDPDERLEVFPVDFNALLIAPAGSSGYTQRLEPAYADLAAYRFTKGEYEVCADQITSELIPEPTGDDDDRPWRFLAEMDEWSLELDSREIDTTAIGQQFGESTRALVTGSGSINFFVNRVEDHRRYDSTFIARLLILLQQGCKAEAVFHVARQEAPYPIRDNQKNVSRGNLSYKAELLLSQNAINTRADDIIRATARFVTIGRVKLVLS